MLISIYIRGFQNLTICLRNNIEPNFVEDGSVEVRRTRTAQGFSEDGSDDYASYYRERKVSKYEFYEALDAKVAQYNIHQEDWKINGPGKFYGYNQFFQMDPVWAATVAAKTGTIEIFESFLETAHADVL